MKEKIMARRKREWFPGATYHVMSRGNRRAEIFKDDSDYMFFLEYIRRIKEKHPFRIHSICLMTNHFHMAIETENTEIWKIMQKILSVYAAEYNHRHHYSGHLFEGRYTACMISDERYFLEVSRYIHLNPVRAQMVREPLAYEYSSYGNYMYRGDDEKDYGNKWMRFREVLGELVDTSRVLSCFGHDGREQYRMFVEGKISHAEQEMLIQKDMKEDEMWLPW